MAGNLNSLMAVRFQTGVSANYDYTATRGFEIVDVHSTCNLTDGATTTDVQTNLAAAPGFANVAAQMATDTVNNVEYAGTIIWAQTTVATADTIRSVVGGCATALQTDTYVWVIPTSWIAG